MDIYLEFADGMRNYDNFYAIHELLGSIFGRRVDLLPMDHSLKERPALSCRLSDMQPSTLELFLDILRETDFLTTQRPKLALKPLSPMK